MTHPEHYIASLLSESEYTWKVLRFRLDLQAHLSDTDRILELGKIEYEALRAYHRCKLVDLKTAFRFYATAEKAKRLRDDALAQERRGKFFLVKQRLEDCET